MLGQNKKSCSRPEEKPRIEEVARREEIKALQKGLMD